MSDLAIIESSTLSKELDSHDVCLTNQLWPFLLELLTNKDSISLIRWIGFDGQFEFLEPETVARLWGLRKGLHNQFFLFS